MRHALVVLHRWVGLGTAIFLAVAALTGSALTYKEELEAFINPHWFLATPSVGTEPRLLDPFQVREKVERAFPQARVLHMSFPQAGHTTMFYLFARDNPDTGQPGVLEVDQVFVNPYTGEIAGSRKWGALLSQGEWQRENIVPFVWRLHEALALPHPWGKVFMGLVALLWTIDCFIGVALTWPRGRPFFKKWAPAWKIKRPSSSFRKNLDIHRAAGLWLWLALLVFAWSSVMLNLRQEVYQPVMSSVLTFDHVMPKRTPLKGAPVISWQEARTLGKQAVEDAVMREGGAIVREESLWLREKQGAWMYRAETSLDVRNRGGGTQAWIDARTGEVFALRMRGSMASTGEQSGHLVSEWLQALHVAQIGGEPYRVFVALLGILIAVLSITGVVIWWHKRRARRLATTRTRPTFTP
ncbi:PepSY-associated TM helix domain-containing protein [Ottowia thiooxydans]|uniref:PepSY-associated TM helix domain-containing protein n=1 Tax=Ottowia thiooxydans TaxID=219182 RepID=UPI00040E4210|nr:PepSY-associated TM helix domain-containing protein [Ottowia thiooxydans]